MLWPWERLLGHVLLKLFSSFGEGCGPSSKSVRIPPGQSSQFMRCFTVFSFYIPIYTWHFSICKQVARESSDSVDLSEWSHSHRRNLAEVGCAGPLYHLSSGPDQCQGHRAVTVTQGALHEWESKEGFFCLKSPRGGRYDQSVCQVPTAAATNYHELCVLRQHKSIILQFWRSEFHNQCQQV